MHINLDKTKITEFCNLLEHATKYEKIGKGKSTLHSI